MQRKSTPLSHPFHGLIRVLLLPAIIHLIGSGICAEPLFHIECPPDTTVDCNAELWDLSLYGTAYVYGYGNPQPAGDPISTEYDLNNCNVGTITRTWVAYDYSGTPYYCSQTITVSAGGSGGVDIQWPPDYIINDCSPLTDPDDLPPPYDRPILNAGGSSCTQLMMSYDDLVFNINPPACKKILRTWTVIDWCTYDPNAYHPEGIWEHTQIIKIRPVNPPVIVCPPDTIVSAGADCTGGYVQLPLAYGSTDCGAGVIITNHSPYAYEHGADASGMYPLGTTKVTFTADDGCGQQVSCSMYVTVKDLKKPTPVCFYGITITLMQMPDGYYMGLRPGFFDKGSFDNCTSRENLKMWVEPDRVDCDDLGPTPVRLYVEDESGNVEFCNTLVYVQDNLGICPPIDGVIEGTVHTMSGNMMPEVKVSMEGTTDFVMTDDLGTYNFPSVRFGHPYTLQPSYHMDHLSGVSTLDMATLLKHILGVQRFTSPYQYIAADLDRSGRVSVNDLLVLKELILMQYTGQTPQTAWRFVDASYVFPDPSNPWAPGFPEAYHIQDFSTDMTALDFIAVKLGDLNDDADGLDGEQVITTRTQGISLVLPDRAFEAGEVFEFAASVDVFRSITAMEFAVRLDNTLLEIESADPGQGISGLDVIHQKDYPTVVSTLWYGVHALETPQLLNLRVRAIKNGRLKDAVQIVNASQAKGYLASDHTAVPVVLTFDANAPVPDPGSVDMQMHLGRNYPNPFSGHTLLPVELPGDSPLTVELMNLGGAVLRTYQFSGTQGLQELDIDVSGLNLAGVVFCRVTSDFGLATTRMLIGTRE